MSQAAIEKQEVFLAGFSSGALPELGIQGHNTFRFNSEVTPSQAACLCAKLSLAETGFNLDQIDFVISCTQTPDFNNPGLVSGLLHKLGKQGCPGLEIKQAACGALYAIDLAANLIRSSQADCILVCCTEFLSRYFSPGLEQYAELDAQVKDCHAIFADGAGAFLVFSEKLKSACRAQNCYRLNFSRAASLGLAESSLCCLLPSSCQFPQRISAEDVRLGRHLPRFDAQAFKQELSSVRSNPEFENLLIRLKQARCIISHQIQAQQNKWLSEVCAIEHDRFFDVFINFRHLASAGLVQGICSWQQEHELGPAETLGLLALGAGGFFGAALLQKAET